MEVLEPSPLEGGCRWVASPMQNTRPWLIRVAYLLLTVQVDTDCSWIARSRSPTRSRTTFSAKASSTFGAGWLISYPHTTSHSFQRRTMRTSPMPIPPTLDPGCSTQYSTEGRWATNRDRSALKRMLMEPATPMEPSKGRPACSATRELPPSAPTRYRERTVKDLPDSRSSRVVVTPSASCSWFRYSVDRRDCVPREQAVLNNSGSMKVCGRSFMKHGDASRCAALDSGCVPQLCSRPSSSPASEVQKTLLPMSSCGVACR